MEGGGYLAWRGGIYVAWGGCVAWRWDIWLEGRICGLRGRGKLCSSEGGYEAWRGGLYFGGGGISKMKAGYIG